VNRDQTLEALEAQPVDHEVVVNVSGMYVELSGIRYDPEREAIVVDVQPEDLTDALRRFFRMTPMGRGGQHALTSNKPRRVLTCDIWSSD